MEGDTSSDEGRREDNVQSNNYQRFNPNISDTFELFGHSSYPNNYNLPSLITQHHQDHINLKSMPHIAPEINYPFQRSHGYSMSPYQINSQQQFNPTIASNPMMLQNPMQWNLNQRILPSSQFSNLQSGNYYQPHQQLHPYIKSNFATQAFQNNPEIRNMKEDDDFQQSSSSSYDKTSVSYPISSSSSSESVPPWLYSTGKLCYSNRQAVVNKAVSKGKKMHKLVKCKYCEEFNRMSSWATLKLRKFTPETFKDHENSSNHVKAVSIRIQSIGQSVLLAQNSTSDRFVDSNDNPKKRRKRNQEMYADINESTEQDTASQIFGLSKAVHVDGVGDSQRSSVKSRDVLKNQPDWLVTEGKLCYSDQQIGVGQKSNLKKKYKRLMCTLCQQYNVKSPWSVMKSRKFETAVILAHEASHYHRTAVNALELSVRFGSEV